MSREKTPAQVLGLAPLSTASLPSVDVKRPARQIAEAIARNLPKTAMFKFHGEFVTIEERKKACPDGMVITEVEKVKMTPARFVTWIEQYMTFVQNVKGEIQTVSLGKVLAEQVLASDAMRRRVREIEEIVPVRLPAWGVDKEGKKALRILPAGYDEKTRIYSLETVKWNPKEVPELRTAVNALGQSLGTFPWAETDVEMFHHKRSVAAFFAFMMGHFCRHLVTRMPMVLVIGNQPGTGKTLLAKYGLAAVYGLPDATPYPKEDAALQKLLFSKLKSGRTFCLIDDMANLSSPTLNQYATSSEISDRLLGGNDELVLKNNMQIISTGNNLTVTPDIARRSLIIDLFDSVKSIDKKIENPMSERRFNDPIWRGEILGVLWGLLTAWDQAGRPRVCHGSAMPSFEDFAELVGSILMHCHFSNPFAKRPDTMDGGDPKGAALERLLKNLAAKVQPEFGKPHSNVTKLFTVPDVVEIATELQVLDIICPGAKNANQSMGHQLRKYKGREYVDEFGRRFTFGRREDSVSSQYNVVILSEPI